MVKQSLLAPPYPSYLSYPSYPSYLSYLSYLSYPTLSQRNVSASGGRYAFSARSRTRRPSDRRDRVSVSRSAYIVRSFAPRSPDAEEPPPPGDFPAVG
jgi:hypothetical protein